MCSISVCLWHIFVPTFIYIWILLHLVHIEYTVYLKVEYQFILFEKHPLQLSWCGLAGESGWGPRQRVRMGRGQHRPGGGQSPQGSAGRGDQNSPLDQELWEAWAHRLWGNKTPVIFFGRVLPQRPAAAPRLNHLEVNSACGALLLFEEQAATVPGAFPAVTCSGTSVAEHWPSQGTFWSTLINFPAATSGKWIPRSHGLLLCLEQLCRRRSGRGKPNRRWHGRRQGLSLKAGILAFCLHRHRPAGSRGFISKAGLPVLFLPPHRPAH